MDVVKQCMKILFSAYRIGDFSDPDGFLAQLGVVLERYPEWVVRRITDPRTGIQTKSRFPPAIAEVVSACEAAYSATRYAEQWDARVQDQLAERAEAYTPKAPPPPRGKIVTCAQAQEMQASGAKIHGVFDKDRQIPYRG